MFVGQLWSVHVSRAGSVNEDCQLRDDDLGWEVAVCAHCESDVIKPLVRELPVVVQTCGGTPGYAATSNGPMHSMTLVAAAVVHSQSS